MAQRLRIILALLQLLLLAGGIASGAVPAARNAREPLFLETSVDNRTPFVGQEVRLTYTLFFTGIAPRVGDAGKAEYPGFWARETTPEGYIASTQASVQGKPFRKAVIKQLVLVPLQGGRLTISNYRLRCLLPVDETAASGTAGETESVISAPPVTINARRLPAPAPQGFSGAVGDFSVEVSPAGSQVHAGEPLTLTVTVRGKGNLRAFPPVEIVAPEGFSSEAAAGETAGPAASGAGGIASRITLVPGKPGTFTFRPVRLSSFNPSTARYETVVSGEISVTVLPALPGSRNTGTGAADGADRKGENIGAPSTTVFVMTAFAAAILAILSLVGMRMRGKAKKASAASGTGAYQAKPHAEEATAAALRDRIYEALKKTGIPKPSGMSSRELMTAMAKRKIGKSEAERVIGLLQAVDEAIYAPRRISEEALAELEKRAGDAVASLSGKG